MVETELFVDDKLPYAKVSTSLFPVLGTLQDSHNS